MKYLQLRRLVPIWLALVVSLQTASFVLAQDDLISALSARSSIAERTAAVEKLLAKGPEAITLLRQGMKQSNAATKIECIRWLGEVKAKEAAPELIQYLQSAEDTHSILVTSYALGQIQDTRATPELVRMASPITDGTTRRRAAIIALGLLGDASATPTLEEILSDDDELLRVFAAGSLGMLGSADGLDVALNATESRDLSTRMHAIQALGLIGSDKALDTLRDMFGKDPSMVERQTTETSIFQIRVHGLPENERISAIKERLLSTPQKTALSRWCIRELARIGGPNAMAELEEVSQRHSNADIRTQAVTKRKILALIQEVQSQENRRAP